MSKIDVSKLSREEKLKLLDLIEEKQRRSRDSRAKFKPHPGQRRVIESEALERFLFCGNGFGKSTILVNELHWAATGFNPITGKSSPVPAKICLLLDAPEKIDDFLTEYQKWHLIKPEQLHKKGKPNVTFITFDNGSTVTVLTHQVEELKLEGSQWTHIFADEPPPRGVFTALFRGGRIKGRPCKVLLAGTPIKAAWLRTDVYEPWVRGETPHVECFQGNSEDNRDNLEEGWLERFSAKLTEKEREIRLRGIFYDVDGLALAHLFRDDVHIIKRKDLNWDRENPCVIVVDPHPSKAHHAVIMGVDRENRIYVLDEYKEKAIARNFTKSLIRLGWFERYKVLDIVYDSLGSGETTSGEGFRPFGDVMNEVLKSAGLGRARATTYEEKSDEDFVERIRDALAIPDTPDNFGQRVPQLRFVEGCGGSVTNVKNVQWLMDRDKENKPKLDIRNQDFLSCIKYGLACNLHFKKKKDKAYYYTKPVYGMSVAPKRAKIRLPGRYR